MGKVLDRDNKAIVASIGPWVMCSQRLSSSCLRSTKIRVALTYYQVTRMDPKDARYEAADAFGDEYAYETEQRPVSDLRL